MEIQARFGQDVYRCCKNEGDWGLILPDGGNIFSPRLKRNPADYCNSRCVPSPEVEDLRGIKHLAFLRGLRATAATVGRRGSSLQHANSHALGLDSLQVDFGHFLGLDHVHHFSSKQKVRTLANPLK